MMALCFLVGNSWLGEKRIKKIVLWTFSTLKLRKMREKKNAGEEKSLSINMYIKGHLGGSVS